MKSINYFMSDGEGTDALSEYLRDNACGYWPQDHHPFSTNFPTIYVLGRYTEQKYWLQG